MALQTSGAISLNDMHVELGATSGTEVSLNDADIRGLINKASGAQASFSEWYGAANAYAYTISSNVQNADARTLALADGWDGTTPLQVTISSGVWCYATSISNGGLTLSGSFPNGVSIINNGNIAGMGGSGNGGNGGPALYITTSDTVDITNNAGAFIAGGGGGGGGIDGGGGAGQSGTPGDTTQQYGGLRSGGGPSISLCNSYSVNSNNTTPNTYSSSRGYAGGGGDGGSAGYIQYVCSDPSSPNYGVADVVYYYRTGAAGKRALTGGSAPTGNLGTAGGFWGQAGSGSGAGSAGAAISGTYNSYTDNGTTYGTT